MAIFTVTTGTDVVDEPDGVTSLREAVNMANLAQGDDIIWFAQAVTNVKLDSAITLANLAIEGSTFDITSNLYGDPSTVLQGFGQANSLGGMIRTAATSGSAI